MNNLDDSIVIDYHMNKNPDNGNYKYYSMHYS